MKKYLLISGCLMFSVACSTPFNSGIGGDTAVNTITGDDEQALCEAMRTEAEAEGVNEASKKVGCHLAGALTAAFSMEEDTEPVCQEVVDECLAEEEEEASDTCELNLDDCAAPLSDFEACIRSGWEEIKTMADEVTCSESDEEAGDDTDTDDTCTSSEACKPLHDACPEFDPCSDA
jgi:hypothetical protein